MQSIPDAAANVNHDDDDAVSAARKSQIPGTKAQTTPKPTLWNKTILLALKFENWSFLGAWDLGFGALRCRPCFRF
jgi:hypothetical protein